MEGRRTFIFQKINTEEQIDNPLEGWTVFTLEDRTAALQQRVDELMAKFTNINESYAKPGTSSSIPVDNKRSSNNAIIVDE